MIILSIDVGIKNLACVIIDFDEDNFTIKNKWDVLDLTDRLFVIHLYVKR